jgi:hypothetical protein
MKLMIEGRATALTIPSRQATYAVGYGKPPVHSRFKKGQSGNPKGGRRARRTRPTRRTPNG